MRIVLPDIFIVSELYVWFVFARFHFELFDEGQEVMVFIAGKTRSVHGWIYAGVFNGSLLHVIEVSILTFILTFYYLLFIFNNLFNFNPALNITFIITLFIKSKCCFMALNVEDVLIWRHVIITKICVFFLRIIYVKVVSLLLFVACSIALRFLFFDKICLKFMIFKEFKTERRSRLLLLL